MFPLALLSSLQLWLKQKRVMVVLFLLGVGALMLSVWRRRITLLERRRLPRVKDIPSPPLSPRASFSSSSSSSFVSSSVSSSSSPVRSLPPSLKEKEDDDEPEGSMPGFTHEEESELLIHAIERRNFSGLKIACSTREVIFLTSLESMCNISYTLTHKLMQSLKSLVSRNDVYFVTRVESDQEEETVRELLEVAGLYDAGLNRVKVLFCSSNEGKCHMIRQLEPSVYIDCDISALDTLKPFIPNVLHVPSMTAHLC